MAEFRVPLHHLFSRHLLRHAGGKVHLPALPAVPQDSQEGVEINAGAGQQQRDGVAEVAGTERALSMTNGKI